MVGRSVIAVFNPPSYVHLLHIVSIQNRRNTVCASRIGDRSCRFSWGARMGGEEGSGVVEWCRQIWDVVVTRSAGGAAKQERGADWGTRSPLGRG